MKRKSWLILLVSLAVAPAVYYLFSNDKRDLDIWKIIPEDAVVVYESEDVTEAWDELKKKSYWSTLTRIPFFQDVDDLVNGGDSTIVDKNLLLEYFREVSFYFSIHPVSKDDLGFLFYVEDHDNEMNVIREVINNLCDQKGWSRERRNYQNLSIYDIRSNSDSLSFSYIFHKNFFIGSTTSFLVEDIIRLLNGKKLDYFKTANSSLFSMEELPHEHGNVYVNFNDIERLLSLFTHDSIKYDNLDNTLSSGLLDLSFHDDHILFSGYSYGDTLNQQFYLNTFENEFSEKSILKEYIPKKSALVYQTNFSDGESWSLKLYNYWEKYLPSQINTWKQFTDTYQYEPSSFYEGVSSEIALCILASNKHSYSEKVVFLRTGNIGSFQKYFDEFVQYVDESKEFDTYYEKFANNTIGQINISDFPSKIFGPVYKGFDQCYYTSINDYMILSTSPEAIKTVLLAIENENTWGKSVEKKLFIDKGLGKSSINILIDVKSAWNALNKTLNPRWGVLFDEFASDIKELDYVSIQFSTPKAGKSYTNICVNHRKNTFQGNKKNTFNIVRNTKVDTLLISKPYVVKNHLDKSLEVLVQSADFSISLISASGKRLWKKKLEGAIVNEVVQIDYFNNKKLQYFISTDKRVYIIDRNGKDVSPFPMSVDEYKIDHATVIDYDNSKNYRFLLADTKGNLYMYNKEAKNLEGWQPRKLKKQLSSAPQHIRIRGKDLIIGVQKNGLVNILNRRGEYYRGFPLDLKHNISSPIYIERGRSLSNTYVTALAENGELIVFNLGGKIISKEQLYKPSKDTKFRLCESRSGDSYVVITAEPNHMVFRDREGKVLFMIDNIGIEEFSAQYYDFSVDNKLFIITDKIQEFTYFYDYYGTLYHSRPIESAFKVSVLYSDVRKSFKVYTTYNDEFSIVSFPKN